MKKYLLLALIIFSAIALRFAYLGVVPNAISGDESHYVASARAVYLTGHDISGTWNPWSLLWFRYPSGEHQAELPYLLHLLVSARHPFSLFLTKLPFAILSAGVVLVLWGIAELLFGSEVGIATAAVAAINPWLIIMGRAGYEATPAMFFYLLSLWILLKTKGWQSLWTIIPLLFAFYSYIGTKVIFTPFVAGICLLAFVKNGRKNFLPYLTLIVFSLIPTLGFLVLTRIDPAGSRLGELFLPNSPVLTHDVNVMRSTTINSPLTGLMINKYVLFVQTFILKIFRIFAPTYLFVEGDQFFLPVRQGFFYFLDAIFLLTGSIYIAVKHRTYAWLLCLLIAVSAVPQLVSTTQGDFSIHLSLLFPLLIIVIGAGIIWAVQHFAGKNRIFVIILCIGLYIINLGGFAQTYFYRSPLIGYADFPKRVLTRYLQLAQARNIPVTVYTTSTGDMFAKYILYSNAISEQNMPALRAAQSSESIQFNGVHFLSCQKTGNNSPGLTIIDDRLCGKPASAHHESITTLTDGGENFIIEQDKVCNGYSLKRYPQNIRLSDFDIESLTEREFCETYISQR